MVELADIYCIDIKLKNAKEHEFTRKKAMQFSENICLDSLIYISSEYLFDKNDAIAHLQYLNIRNKAQISAYIQLRHNDKDANEIFNGFEKKIMQDLNGLEYNLSIKKEFDKIDKTVYYFKSQKSFSSKIKLPVINCAFEETEKIKYLMAFIGSLELIALTYLAVEKFFRR